MSLAEDAEWKLPDKENPIKHHSQIQPDDVLLQLRLIFSTCG